ncbi:hypothetical protein SBOR_9915 [Sclerotinia borealis F-4128]|uniref:Uncharacterized protein n=1 Tax=Sclerotinia borealis (strain F-4128) TaxID=1432307 RepID=W9BYM2_SCLBF|nr:hypothetical protein SBOR_9915 [Sclerotinia borealis F-4128]
MASISLQPCRDKSSSTPAFSPRQMSCPNPLRFPMEIRQMIYMELLVASEPVSFATDPIPNEIQDLLNRGLPLPDIPQQLHLYGTYGLCPALLQANKQVHDEAHLLLYTGNRFDFTNNDFKPSLPTNHAVLSLFLDGIGDHNAGLLRYIHIDFPSLEHSYRLMGHKYMPVYDLPSPWMIRYECIELIKQIRERCTQVTVVKMLVQNYHECGDIATSSERSHAAENILNWTNEQLQAVPQLKKIIVDFRTWEVRSETEVQKKKLSDYGWKVQMTELKKSWNNDNNVYGSWFDERKYFDHSSQLWKGRFYYQKRLAGKFLFSCFYAEG